MTVRFLADEDIARIARFLHFERLASGESSPGLCIVPNKPSAVGESIEWLLLVWAASQSEEWRDQIVYLPLH